MLSALFNTYSVPLRGLPGRHRGALQLRRDGRGVREACSGRRRWRFSRRQARSRGLPISSASLPSTSAPCRTGQLQARSRRHRYGANRRANRGRQLADPGGATANRDHRKADRTEQGGERLLPQQVHQPGTLRMDDQPSFRPALSDLQAYAGHGARRRTLVPVRARPATGAQSFIQGQSWDSQRQGLLSGYTLGLALQRMQSAFIATDARRFEITKSISLLQLDPMAFLKLKSEGACEFDLRRSAL